MTEIEMYIHQFSESQQQLANALYGLLRELLPEAEERINYAMPTFWQGKAIVYFGISKHHVGFYPTAEPIAHFAAELSSYQTTKGAIHLSLDQPLPKELITKIVRYRLAHLNDRAVSPRQSRPRQVMPEEVFEALKQADVMTVYEARPPYQRNDYLSWIKRAKRPATQAKRLAQMVAELQQGDTYMKMAWSPKKHRS
ncbi:YdeI/OmpD-associated family protein [Secundilactobacillus kimchicus]|uniref:YdeI/OmpD-associated family protein n=1 Tax=Secundilactobacillus kimchicus TaxID=528209 RepID=UPI0024A9529E|nr:DUF1801 domain-containing protein [Secundilactobacillus kimchicus]